MFQRRLARHVPPGSFAAHVMTMVTGTAVAQAIPIAVAPVLTRLYAPEQFGVFGGFQSLSVILAVAASFRYELAVMLPGRDEDAFGLVALTVACGAALGTLMLLPVWLFQDALLRLLGGAPLGPWLFLLPFAAMLICGYQALNYWTNRKRRYRRLAASLVAQYGANAAVSIVLGAVPFAGNGLIVGSLAGQAAGAAVLAGWVLREDRHHLGSLSAATLLSRARDYWRFPAFNTPYSLIGTFSQRFPDLILNTFRHAPAAGAVNFSRQVVFAPISFLSTALGQVFFQEAAATWGTPRLELRVRTLVRLLCEAGAPAAAFLVVWSTDLFRIAFGARWEGAGGYAAAFASVAYCYLFTTWPERIFEVARRQQVSLAVRVVGDAASTLTLWGLLAAGFPPLACVQGYAAAVCLFQVVFLTALFRVGGISVAVIADLAIRTAVLGGGFGGLFLLPGAAGLSRPLQIGIGGALLGLYYAAWLRRWMRPAPDAPGPV